MKEYIIKVNEDKKDIMGNYSLVEKPKELIRCKDCKKRYTVLCIQEEAGNINNQDDWFCADGERRGKAVKLE